MALFDLKFSQKKHAPRISLCILLVILSILACKEPVTTKPEQPLTPTVTQEAGAPESIETLQPSPLPSPTPLPTLTNIPTLAPTPTPQAVRFAVIGDYGQGDQAELDVANLVKSWQPDFVVTVGDNNYPSGSPQTIDQNIGKFYHEFIFPYHGSYGQGADTNRFFPVLGNHDWDTDGAKAYFDYFSLPNNERYYDFVIQPIHFFALDSDSREPDGVNRSSIQAAWLKEKLAAATEPWKIVVMHHPPYSSGVHGSVDWMRWPFGEWGAHVVLSGHDHIYERLMVNGVLYFINGLGGGPRYPLGAVLPESQARFAADWGAMLVVADSRQIEFQFITRRGEVIDNYKIEH